MPRDLAIILNNGSVNSAVITALAAQKFRTILLHVEAAPNPGSRRRAAYDQQTAHFKPYREHTLSMPFLTQITQAPEPTATDPRHPTPLAGPMRALLPLLAAAGQFAGMYEAAAIYLGLRIGPNIDELAQATEYQQIWTELLQLPCGLAEVELITPLLELEPWQVVDLGFNVSAPFDRTWSCQEETSDPCWACKGCRQREQSFIQASKADPLRVPRKI